MRAPEKRKKKEKEKEKPKGPILKAEKGQENKKRGAKSTDSSSKIYPALKNLDIDSSEDSTSSESEKLSPDEEAELEAEATKYDQERYHPDEENTTARVHPRANAPSAPPLPYAPPLGENAVGISRIPQKVKEKLRTAFPVFEQNDIPGRIHVPVDFGQLKELVEAVRKYGPSANYTLVMLERFTDNYLTPNDWQTVARAALPNMG